MFDKIIITIDNEKTDRMITFLKDGIIEFHEVFESIHHNEYLNLDITEYKFIQN
jgi:hypothetical protein